MREHPSNDPKDEIESDESAADVGDAAEEIEISNPIRFDSAHVLKLELPKRDD